MRLLVAIPTLSRVDLLVRNRAFLESVSAPDEVLILDNGDQQINISVPIERPPRNLGVSGSWNLFMRRAFVERDFDALTILQDDIVWDVRRLSAARALLQEHEDVDLFLSHLQFSVQIQRRRNLDAIGLYDEIFHPAYCEDDDYAIRMTLGGYIYERFHELDPLPGSQIEGTRKSVAWAEQNRKLTAKWGARAFGVNVPHASWYRTNRGSIQKQS